MYQDAQRQEITRSLVVSKMDKYPDGNLDGTVSDVQS